MRKLVVLTTWLFVSLTATAAQFTKGVHYQELATPVANKAEVREFFSFYCPHCFRQEPLMNDLASSLPDKIKFEKNHVDGMPGQQQAIEQALSKSVIIAQHYGIKDQVVADIFNHIHTNKAQFGNVEDIKQIFVRHGVSAKQFDKAYTSFSVNALVKKMQKKTKLLNQQGIVGVPTLIVNGKYRPLTDKLKSIEEYKALIQYLISLN